jgi:multidrug efflux pump subunit AcrA (membrane-fusion protein)
LTEIVSVKPIYVNLEFNERDLLPYLRDMPNEENPTGGSGTDGSAKKKELELVLSDGSKFGEIGRLDFVDNTIDTASGTIKSRAVFPNKEALLADGLFGRIRIPEVFPNAVQVPANVIQRDIGGSYVLLAGADNKVVRRTVIPTKFSLGSMKIVEPFDEATGTGLQADDWLIVSNLQRAREGIVVKPVEAKPAASPEAPKEEPAAKEVSAE